ncbi:MAG: hypothetical protein JNJ90_14220 [Saprospiraceae bacterium]|jgi:hypothetical protein|nr:hypothetical protein [Saprospiraceae bacterium]
MADERNSKLLITFAVFLFLFNFPIIGMVDRQGTWLGMPLLFIYLFFVWLLLIAVVAVIVSRKNKN